MNILAQSQLLWSDQVIHMTVGCWQLLDGVSSLLLVELLRSPCAHIVFSPWDHVSQLSYLHSWSHLWLHLGPPQMISKLFSHLKIPKLNISENTVKIPPPTESSIIGFRDQVVCIGSGGVQCYSGCHISLPTTDLFWLQRQGPVPDKSKLHNQSNKSDTAEWAVNRPASQLHLKI